jgi:hypothetical protein
MKSQTDSPRQSVPCSWRGHHLAAIVAVLVACSSGCTGTKFWKSQGDGKPPQGVPTAPLGPQVNPDGNPIVQASATAPASAAAPTSISNSLARMTGDGKKASKSQATELVVTWRNRIDYLPNPARNGELGPGLAGQVFLFSSNMQPVNADGTITVDLYDETPRPPGQPPNKPERWEFTREILKNLRSVDDRFGKDYVLFLPWPTYRFDVSRVRITVRYDAENGQTLYAPQSNITIDTSLPNSPSLNGSNPISMDPNGYSLGGSSGMSSALSAGPLAGGTSAMGPLSGGSVGPLTAGNAMPGFAGGVMPVMPQAPYGTVPPVSPGFGSVSPVPQNYGALIPVAPGPQGLPPIAFTTSSPGR